MAAPAPRPGLGDPVIPANTGIQVAEYGAEKWIPAFAGMTGSPRPGRGAGAAIRGVA